MTRARGKVPRRADIPPASAASPRQNRPSATDAPGVCDEETWSFLITLAPTPSVQEDDISSKAPSSKKEEWDDPISK